MDIAFSFARRSTRHRRHMPYRRPTRPGQPAPQPQPQP
ncbi:hypothetical protein BURPS305_1982 [Burkholderia pseudomallei 305]|nr:hypothetical protein BURPS305_1982 [Burkholderia pseudomallei 305]